MKKWRLPLSQLGLRAQLSLVVIISFGLSLGVIAFITYSNIQRDVQREQGNRLKQIASSASVLIHPQKHARVVESYLGRSPTIERSRDFQDLQWVLRQIQRAHDLDSDISTFIVPQWKADTMVFMVMSNPKPYIGNGIPLNPSAKTAIEKAVSNYSNVFTDKTGTWMSGYAALLGPDGKVAGGIAVDYRLNKALAAAYSRWLNRVAMPFLGTFLFAVALFMAVLNRIFVPFQKARKVAESIAVGNLSARFGLPQKGDLGALTWELDKLLDDLAKQKQRVAEEYRSLERKTENRTSQLNDKTRLLETLSSVMHEGFMVFDPQGKLVELPSLAADRLLERGQDSVYLWDILHASEEALKPAYQNLFREKVAFADVIRTLPQEIETPARKHLSLEYHPVKDESQRIHWIAVTLSDKTLEMAATEFAEAERNRVLLSRNRLRYPHQLKEALLDLKVAVAETKSLTLSADINASTISAFLRRVKAIRELSEMFSLQPILALSSHFESELLEFEEAPEVVTKAILPRLQLAVREFENALDTFLRTHEDILGHDYLTSEGEVVISKRLVKSFAEQLKKLPGPSPLHVQFEDWFVKEPVWHAFSHLELVAHRLAFQENKLIAPIKVEGGDIRADLPSCEEAFPWIEGILRNAIQHGIETKRERESAGKPAEGQIGITFSLTSMGAQGPVWLNVMIQDDGRGIDVNQLRKLAVIEGINVGTLSNHDLLQLVFKHEIWRERRTSEENSIPTLAWIQHEVAKKDGIVEITSQYGQGTTVTLLCPLGQAMLRQAA